MDDANKLPMKLVSKIERTEIESKSQRWSAGYFCPSRWYQRQKELKLKANHNWTKNGMTRIYVGIKDRKN